MAIIYGPVYLYFFQGKVPPQVIVMTFKILLGLLPFSVLMTGLLKWIRSRERKTTWLVTPTEIRILHNDDLSATVRWDEVSRLSCGKGKISLFAKSPLRYFVLHGIQKADFQTLENLWARK